MQKSVYTLFSSVKGTRQYVRAKFRNVTKDRTKQVQECN